MNQRISGIIEDLAKLRLQIGKNDVIFSDSTSKWFGDCTFLLEQLHERDERIRKLEKIIVDDMISKL